MKKTISVITLIPRSSRFYAEQVQALFGQWAQVHSYSTGDRSVEGIVESDLYLLSTDAFEDAQEARRYVPSDGQVVEIQLTYPKEVIQDLKRIQRGTRVLFVNATRQMAREAITQLEQLGVNQLQFEPYGPDSLHLGCSGEDGSISHLSFQGPANKEVWKGIDIAVTPDEEAFVPAGMKQVINIGPRCCTPATVMEAAIHLGLERLLEGKHFQNYKKTMANINYSFEQMFVRSRRLESRLDILIEILDEGMIGVDETGEIFAINQKARDITGVDSRSVMGRQGDSVFPYIPFGTCIREKATLTPRLIRIGSANVNLSVVPVLHQGECIGAFATLQRFNDLEKRQNELRSQLLHKGYRAKYCFEDVVGSSQAIEKTKALLRRMAATESPVLLIGETGTGKELFAHAVHRASRRSDGPFVAINVAAMPENLLESELFGYEEGAFTGAKKGGRPGLFEFAHKGTLFLDEVEGMSQAMQVKLLRVLQEREIMRVGGNQIINVDVRIVAATNESLEEKVEEGSFRRDLYYRLNALPVLIPPLRERENDILLLIDHFRRQSGGSFSLSGEIRSILLKYSWPGNIRELQNVVDYFSFTGHKEVCMEDLPPTFLQSMQRDRGKQKQRDGMFRVRGEYQGGNAAEAAGGLQDVGSSFPDKAEFWYVLEQLYRASEEERPVGREAILQAAKSQHFPLSQKEIRDILEEMSKTGMVKVSRGRGGSRITPLGRSVWEQALKKEKV